MGHQHISNDERRRRLARRHALAGDARVDTPLAATRTMGVLHATEAASVHLAIAARTNGVRIADVDDALYAERSIVKQLAMRRTLFVFGRELLPAAWASASARVAQQQRRRVAGAVERAAIAADGQAWLDEMCEQVVSLLREHPDGLKTADVRAAIPGLDVRASAAVTSTKWAEPVQLAPWVLTVAGLQARVVRGAPDGRWRNPRPHWSTMEQWIDTRVGEIDQAQGYAELIGRYLEVFGPATEDDIVWWLGATKGAVRTALGTIGAVTVELDDGSHGYVVPGDTDPEPDLDDWAVLLPTLDPTLMGWKHRDFYLDPKLRPYLFDTNGNGGSTAWWNGRVVGCWVQDPGGTVRTVLQDDIGAQARRALDLEASRLTDFLGCEVVSSVYASSMQRGALLP